MISKKFPRFFSVPGGVFFHIIYIIGILFMVACILYEAISDCCRPFPILIGIIIITLWIALLKITSPYAVSVLEFHEDRVVCLIPFYQKLEIEYNKCFIGFDYHNQNGNKIWWIYLCYGKMPPYKNPKLGNRINSIKCQPGFVRIMYRDDVYDALMDVLPKKQKTALASARRNSGFEKQGKII